MKKPKKKKIAESYGLSSISPIDELLRLSDDKVSTGDEFLVDDEPQTHSSPTLLEEFDISTLVDSEIDNFSPISRDLRIDDSNIPRAENFYEFCMGEEFLNSPPYLEQALIGIRFMAEYCPRCSDLDWMSEEGHEATDGLPAFEKHVALLENGVCPHCGATKSELIQSKELNFYNELAICAGQRSGKSAVTTMIAAYVLHRFLMIGKPTELFGIRPNEILHGTFLALTLGQAKENLWDPFYGYITESPWFKNYHKFLRYYERKYGEQFLKLKDTFILYRHRNMLWYPATPDKRTLRGRTRIFGAIDELGWFDANRDSNKVKDNAHEVYKALSNSLATARQSENRLVKSGYDQALTGYMVNVSSPSSIRDKITELVRLSQGSKKLLGLHRPTWKMNPNLPFDSDIIQEEYRKDPVGAARDFGAEPSLGSHPFISNRKRIEETVREAGQNFVKYKLVTAREGVGKEATKHRTAEILGVKRDQQISVMALDAGVVNNSFALSVGSLYEGVPVIDCLVEIIPLPGVPVSFSSVYSDVIIPLCEKRNVRILLADRWNSIKLLEDARRELVDADGEPLLQVARQYSLKYTDMYAVKDAIDLNMFKIPRCEVTDVKSILEHDPDDYPKVFEHRPVEHLLLQFATIQDAAKKMVLKGDGFTDDLWRSSALCYWGLTNPDYQEILQTKAEEVAGTKIDYAAMHMRKMSSLPGGVSAGGGDKQASGSKFWGIKKSLR